MLRLHLLPRDVARRLGGDAAGFSSLGAAALSFELRFLGLRGLSHALLPGGIGFGRDSTAANPGHL